MIPRARGKLKHGCCRATSRTARSTDAAHSDMKAGVAAMTMAMKALKECGVKLKGDVITEYVMDEELSGNGTNARLRDEGYKADAGICCETSSMCVQPGSIGAYGSISASRARPPDPAAYEGVNAIDLGYIVTKAVAAFEKVRVAKVSHPLYPNIIEAIPAWSGSSKAAPTTGVSGQLPVKSSLATVPGEDSKQVKAEFVEFVRGVFRQGIQLAQGASAGSHFLRIFRGAFGDTGGQPDRHDAQRLLQGRDRASSL